MAFALTTSALAAEPAFDVVSVKLNKSNDPSHSNVPLGPGDVFAPTGGSFLATNFPLASYITFAYKIMGSQAVYFWPQLPKWVKEEHYDIQARAEGNPTKDELRAMMRALLADRFQMVVRRETREMPVFDLVIAGPGRLGSRLQAHPPDALCPAPPNTVDEFPIPCGGIYGQKASAPNHLRLGGRNIPMQLVADSFPTLGLGRPVFDKTGLKGNFDFTIDWAPDSRDPREPGEAGIADPSGPSFQLALKQQLGLELKPRKGPLEVLLLDRIEHPSAN